VSAAVSVRRDDAAATVQRQLASVGKAAIAASKDKML
jgi:hypothetical protein